MPVSEACEDFNSNLQRIIDQYAPLKTVSSNLKLVKREAWMTKGLMKSSRTMDKLHKVKLKLPKEHPKYTQYTKYRCIFNTVKPTATKYHFQSQLDINKNDMAYCK